ncbi:MAG TPA: tetratricopeptide repeat protein [Anaerolineae bacterium]|nr:tetratricopeptide repeat protein [Anaerolineae bacterium]
MKLLKVGWLVGLLVGLLIGGVVWADSAELGTFEVATQLYENGNYGAAAALFEQLVEQGYEDADLLHNLASAKHKQGNYGEAILYYRRALQIAPRNRDTRANLELAREHVTDQFQRSDVGLFETLTQLSNWLTLTEVTVIALLLWFALAIVWYRYRHPKSEREHTAMQSALIILAISFLLLVVAGGTRYRKNQVRPDAVVIVDEVAVLDTLGGKSELFTLHDGAEVEIVEKKGNWVKLTLPGDALQGWISAEAIGFVNSTHTR